MTAREALHRIVDDLQDGDLSTATRVLGALRATGDPVLQAMLSAPVDDEPDNDDFDGGLTEARREAEQGLGISHEDVKRDLGIA